MLDPSTQSWYGEGWYEGGMGWDGVGWGRAGWRWDEVGLGGMKWEIMGWGGMVWGGVGWGGDGMGWGRLGCGGVQAPSHSQPDQPLILTSARRTKLEPTPLSTSQLPHRSIHFVSRVSTSTRSCDVVRCSVV